jgi:hypothetical protein
MKDNKQGYEQKLKHATVTFLLQLNGKWILAL